ncbi:MAG: putative phosphate transport protein (TIGR00153 family) [Saprospiraceae bacterium]
MARSSYISNMFGYSPIAPLQKHMGEVYKTVCHLTPLFEAMVKEDWDTVKVAQAKVADGEHTADDLKREMRHHLPKGLFMPVDRRDVLDVLLMQDEIANQAKDVSGVILSRKMSLPESMKDDFIVFGARCIDAVEQSLTVISTLDELLEAGFRGLDVDRVEDQIDILNTIEGETDMGLRKLQRELFEYEDELSPVDVMFTYQILNSIGDIADYAQRVGSRLQLMLAR